MIGKGTRLAKEVKEAMMGMVVTRGPATMAVMDLVATMAATIGPVTSQVMTMTRAAMMTGLVTIGDYNGANGHEDEDISAGKDGLEYYEDEQYLG